MRAVEKGKGGNIMISGNNNLGKKIFFEEGRSLQGQLVYVNQALASSLENWERKEFETSQIELLNDIANWEERKKLLGL
jgi:hypothetical protein